MTKYRVIKSGTKYKIQKRFLFFWWSTIGKYKYSFFGTYWGEEKYETLNDAKNQIKQFQVTNSTKKEKINVVYEG